VCGEALLLYFPICYVNKIIHYVMARCYLCDVIQVCGEAEVWGDFIVPQTAAHLPGSTQIDLDGVFHSPLGEKLPIFGPWYGSESILPLWESALDGSATPASTLAADSDDVVVAVSETITPA
jgi:hypothetical protein